jgi:hypothetical protein
MLPVDVIVAVDSGLAGKGIPNSNMINKDGQDRTAPFDIDVLWPPLQKSNALYASQSNRVRFAGQWARSFSGVLNPCTYMKQGVLFKKPNPAS